MTGRYIMKFLSKVIAVTMIASIPLLANAGTYLDLQKALLFKQHGQFGKAYPILLQLAEDELVRAQMELADMYSYDTEGDAYHEIFGEVLPVGNLESCRNMNFLKRKNDNAESNDGISNRDNELLPSLSGIF